MEDDFSRYRVLSFDCYGTLIDWESGIATALGSWASTVGLEVKAAELITSHARHETVVQQAHPGWLYPKVLAETLRRIGADYSSAVSDEAARAYGESIGDWPAFPDSADALASLASSFQLVINSNVDRRSIALSQERLGVEFDLVITAEDVGAYKPALANFRFMFAALERMGVERASVLHVAESLYHDHGPAREMGIPSVWIHRRQGKEGFGATAPPTDDYIPTSQYPSMAEFARAVAG